MDRVDPPGQRQPAGRFDPGGQPQDGNGRAHARGAQAGGAGDRPGADGGRAHGGGHLAGGGRDGVGAGGLGLARQRIPQRIVFHRHRDAAHHGHRLRRPGAHRGFARKHAGIGAVIDGGGHIGGLGPGRRRARDHRLQHLGRHHHRLARLAAGPEDAPLHPRHLFGRHLHAQIAPRHHDAIGQRHDIRQAGDRRRPFQLGHHRRPPGHQTLRLGDVVGPLHEGERHPVCAQLQREGEVVAVPGRQRRDRQMGAGQVEALVIGKPPAAIDRGLGKAIAAADHPKPHPPVVQQHGIAGGKRPEDLRMGHADAVLVARRGVEIEAEGLARDQHRSAFAETADAQLRPLQIGHQPDRAPTFRLQRPHGVATGAVIGMAAMAHIEAENIGPGREQAGDGLRRRGCGPQRRHDLPLPFAAHGLPPSQWLRCPRLVTRHPKAPRRRAAPG